MGMIRALPEALGNVNFSATAIAVVTLAVGVLWPQRLARLLPRLERRHAAGCAVDGRRTGHRTGADGSACVAVRAAFRRLPGPRAGTRDHPGPARLGGQPPDLPGRRFADRHAPQSGPGAGRPGSRQHGGGALRGAARGRGDHGHRGQHPRRRHNPVVGCAARTALARAGAGPRPLRRADPAGRARRRPDEGRLGHHQTGVCSRRSIASGANTCSSC